MIDDRNNSIIRRSNVNNRFSESLPDYEDVKVRPRDKSATTRHDSIAFPLPILGRLCRLRLGHFREGKSIRRLGVQQSVQEDEKVGADHSGEAHGWHTGCTGCRPKCSSLGPNVADKN